MAYIRTVAPPAEDSEWGALYKRVGNPDGTIDNVMTVHSLSPESLRAHFELYVTAMHRPSPLSRAEREIVGTVVSRLNGCAYCVAHHAAGLKRLLPAERAGVAESIVAGVSGRAAGLTEREAALVGYAEKLTRAPGSMVRGDVEALRAAGVEDRGILDLAQVVAYFCYVNRMVLGLGVELEVAGLGQHPVG